MSKQSKRIAILHDRAKMLAEARKFFATRRVIEVDCPILSFAADIAVHIDLISARFNQTKICYMHPSPEYGMKRLLSEGIGDIYQLSHVFRDNECSHKHNPEFMMVEWYREGMEFEGLIKETMEFICLFLDDVPHRVISYREAFQLYAGFDYVHADNQQLLDYIEERNLPSYTELEKDDIDALLNIILVSVVEPHLGKDELCALAYYPSTQAALAKTQQRKDEKVAERFEIYYKGIELCNGYHELTDPHEQRIRFIEANKKRIQLGKQALPIDEEFIKALEKGMPDCCGVAVGFDRLMMLRHETDQISDVFPFILKETV